MMGTKPATFVALPRGVNNVGARRVAMADLRALFEELGFGDVRTLLNSGNVIFSARGKRRGEVRALIEKATNPSHLLVLVPQLPSGIERLKPLLKKHWTPEVLALGSRVAYVWCAKGVAQSPQWAAVDRALNERARHGTLPRSRKPRY